MIFPAKGIYFLNRLTRILFDVSRPILFYQNRESPAVEDENTGPSKEISGFNSEILIMRPVFREYYTNADVPFQAVQLLLL